MEVGHLAYRVASRYLLSKDRYQRETGESLPRWKQVLNEYEASGNNFVHFSFVPKLGVYPNNTWDTPTGFYSYPLKYAQISDFATERPYAVIFKVKPGANVLRVSQYGESDLQRDLSKLRSIFPLSEVLWDDLVRESMEEAPSSSPSMKIWRITRKLSETQGGRFVHKWTTILWKTLGYDGVYDDRGYGVIHENEPYQAVFFNIKALDLKDLLQLYSIKMDQYGQFVGVKSGPTTDFVKQRSLEEREKAHEKKRLRNDSYIDADLSNRDFSGENLSGKVFKGTNFSGTNLEGTMLSSTDLTGANLTRADIEASNLSGANLSGANLTSTYAKGADLSGVNFSRADLTQATLERANLNLSNLVGARLTDANLSDAKIFKATLKGANLAGANLSGANLAGANLAKANLANSRLYLTGIFKANLSGANLSGANIESANLGLANLTGANLSKAKLTGADLTGATLSTSVLAAANLFKAKLTGANLYMANLKGANLYMANLAGADLSGADLTGADLSGADLTGADLYGVKLDGVKLNGVKGYNP